MVLRAYRLPAGLSYTALHDALKAQGYVIYAGQGNLSKILFRISTMGNVSAADIERLLKCFSRLLEEAGRHTLKRYSIPGLRSMSGGKLARLSAK